MSVSSPPASRQNDSTIVLRRGDDRVLVSRDGGGWALPSITTLGHWHAEVSPLNAALEGRFGVRATTLRTLGHRLDEATNRAQAVVAMELRDAGAAAAGLRWVSADEVLELAPRDQQDIIAAWFDQASFDRARPLRRDWSRPGWFDRTLAWCEERLIERDTAPVGPPEQIKHWSIASIWRLPVRGGHVWLKAVPPFFAHEGSVLQLVAPTMPEHVPQVIATDRERGLLLLEELPPDTLRARPDSAANDRAVRLLARLQQAWADRIDDLLAAGCVDRRLSTLDGALNAILARDAVRERFTDDEIRRLREFGETVPALIDDLRSCGVPETLVHGDFCPGNIAYDGERLVIFDWTDACVSHRPGDVCAARPGRARCGHGSVSGRLGAAHRSADARACRRAG
jgi:aminoglycoside phosphotransferase